METWPRRNLIWSSSPPPRWQRRADVLRRSCGANLSMPAVSAALFTISQSTFGVMPWPQIFPDLLIALIDTHREFHLLQSSDRVPPLPRVESATFECVRAFHESR